MCNVCFKPVQRVHMCCLSYTWILSTAYCNCWAFMVPCNWGFPKPRAYSGVRSGRRRMLSVDCCSRVLLSLRRTERVSADVATVDVCILRFFWDRRRRGSSYGVPGVPSFPLSLLCKKPELRVAAVAATQAGTNTEVSSNYLLRRETC